VPIEPGPDVLVRRAAAGDERAWNELVDRYAALVWYTARSAGLSPSAAADVSQTTWLRLAEHLDRIRQPERVAAWLAVTTQREARRVSRIEARSVLVDPWTELANLESGDDPDLNLRRAEDIAAVQRALAELSSRCRELLTALVSDPPVSYEQISQSFDVPVGSIGPTRRRCLDHLRGLLTHHDASELGDLIPTRRSDV